MLFRSSGNTKETVVSETSKQTEKTTAPQGSYTKTNDTRYAKSDVNVRSGPGTSNSKLGMLSRGQEVKRIGITSNGWGVIQYNNREGYVSDKYLIENKPAETQKVAETSPVVTNTSNNSKPVNTTKTVETKPVETKKEYSNNSSYANEVDRKSVV